MATDPSERLALLVGIDRYRHLPPAAHLRGAVRDAEGMADLLERRFGFPASEIRLLRNEEATRRAVLNALEDLVQRATPGTVAVIHWSGHGSRVASVTPEGSREAPQDLDETLVPHDARGEGVWDLRDKELFVYLSRLAARGVFVTWIADACHSGHLYRDRRFGRARSLTADPRTAPELPPGPVTNPRGLPSGVRDGLRHSGRQVLLAACHADQEAFERPLFQREAHGEWTFALLRVLQDSPQGATARQVADQATALLLARDVPQLPQLVGARDRLIFGVEARPPVRFIEIRKREGVRVELAGGRAHGLVEGSLWSVYPARTYEPTPEDVAEQVRVVRVGALSSGAETLQREGSGREIKAGDWAFEAVPAYGELRLPVRLLGLSSAVPWQELEQKIHESPVLREGEADEEDCVSIELGESHCSVVDARGFPLTEPFAVADPATPENVVGRLVRRARWRHGLRLENRDPASTVTASLQVKLLRQEADGAWRPATVPSEVTMGASPRALLPEFRSGDLVALEVSHTFEADLYLYVLDFGLTDGVTQLFPPEGGEECLPPGVRIRPGTLAGDELELWLPDELAGREGGVGLFKVFATTHPTDFVWLRTDVRWPSTRRSGPTSLARLLTMGAPGPVFRKSGEDWGTVLRPIWLRR